ncbi:M20/M25/M40 family metallo-hydrolase [Mesobacillus campisalis]|uniref:M20/M25/M40 family metallo-hydrolase n=1 Tax=Mesobacillus campisalis TaxID=1408103 RepID=UPI000A07D84F|nr:M20/M25/M40 family metallo-hydrolase [Mesobacillus campisalis]
MQGLLWDNPDSLRNLLCELVSWESRTHTEGERIYSSKLREKMLQLDYFQQNPEHLSLHDAEGGRQLLTAFYRHPEAVDTVVLISHFDTVATEEYGDLEPLACQPELLTRELLNRKADLNEEARIDLESGKYLFGRGTMDMKMGLALHMSLMEKASSTEWPVNLVLVTVPDEEVNSAGMRAAVLVLVKLRQEFGLHYTLFLNGEPSFTQNPGDQKHYIYTGSMGKIMPAALFFGKESHVGEPLSGITAPYISSFLTQQMEWNPLFRETELGESTPLPVSLQQKDLKGQYSTQTPYHAVALYNVFILKRSADQIMDLFELAAREAALKCNQSYKALCQREHIEGVGEVQVLRYRDLQNYAEKKLGKDLVERVKEEVLKHPEWDEREKSLRTAEQLMVRCKELAPAIVLLFAPPYYPAVNSSDDPLIIESVQLLKEVSAEFGIEVGQVHYFNGICDLSYVNYQRSDGWVAFEHNTPIWGSAYSIPFREMFKLQAPVLNVGPFGKDAHQSTERLHIESAFVQTPAMIEKLIWSICKRKGSGTGKPFKLEKLMDQSLQESS